MTENALVQANVIESVVIGGDLSKLTPPQRVSYYQAVCKSLGINPLTRPFDYINLNGKLVLYAKKDATDQLRKLHEVSIDDVDIRETDSQFIVKVKGHDKTGRADVEVGVVNKSDMQGNAANAQMKAVTKGKRRLTLSLVGLGWLDETEVETIPDAKPVIVSEEGEIVGGEVHEVPSPKADRPYSPELLKAKMAERVIANEGRAADKKMMGLMMGALEMCFAGEEKALEKRHSVLAYLFGVQSGVDLAPAQVLALREWLKPEPDSGGAWFPDEMAEQEAQFVLVARMAQLGQEALFGQ